MKMKRICYVCSCLVCFALALLGPAPTESSEVLRRPEAMKVKPDTAVLPVAQPIPRVDIALYDVWLDPGTCRLWVAWKNTGNQKIENVTLKERVTVSGLSIPGESMNRVALESGGYWSHGVGADPGVTLQGTRTVTAIIDADNVLKESDEANNTKVKTLTCGQ